MFSDRSSVPCFETFIGLDTEDAQRQRLRVAAGALPSRYSEPWGKVFFDAARRGLAEGATILDVGSGRSPTLPIGMRPAVCDYVGLDVSASELGLAGAGAYDSLVVADIGARVAELEGRFDLVLSWQVLEHVSSIEAAFANMHAYLRPGGVMVAQISGSFAAFALLARVIPYRVSSWLMERLLSVDPEEKFPTRYDRCYQTALEPLLEARWSEHQIVPRYRGGDYFRFSRLLERAYLRYENWTERSANPNLATHYVVSAVK